MGSVWHPQVDHEIALEMIDKATSLAVLKRHRVAAPDDLPALVDAVVAVSELGVCAPDVVEAEANPVLVRSGGVVALDSLVRRARSCRELRGAHGGFSARLEALAHTG